MRYTRTKLIMAARQKVDINLNVCVSFQQTRLTAICEREKGFTLSFISITEASEKICMHCRPNFVNVQCM